MESITLEIVITKKLIVFDPLFHARQKFHLETALVAWIAIEMKCASNPSFRPSVRPAVRRYPYMNRKVNSSKGRGSNWLFQPWKFSPGQEQKLDWSRVEQQFGQLIS